MVDFFVRWILNHSWNQHHIEDATITTNNTVSYKLVCGVSPSEKSHGSGTPATSWVIFSRCPGKESLSDAQTISPSSVGHESELLTSSIMVRSSKTNNFPVRNAIQIVIQLKNAEELQ